MTLTSTGVLSAASLMNRGRHEPGQRVLRLQRCTVLNKKFRMPMPSNRPLTKPVSQIVHFGGLHSGCQEQMSRHRFGRFFAKLESGMTPCQKGVHSSVDCLSVYKHTFSRTAQTQYPLEKRLINIYIKCGSFFSRKYTDSLSFFAPFLTF